MIHLLCIVQMLMMCHILNGKAEWKCGQELGRRKSERWDGCAIHSKEYAQTTGVKYACCSSEELQGSQYKELRLSKGKRWVIKGNKGQMIKVCCAHVLSQFSCIQLCDPMDCSPPGSSVHGIIQARILEWVAMTSYRGSSQPRGWASISCISCTGRWIPYHCVTWEFCV